MERGRNRFFESFKSYDEAGQPSRIRCLKYLRLANMLMGNQRLTLLDFEKPDRSVPTPEVVVIHY